MECLLQYWDELDDLYWAAAALCERGRRLLHALAFLLSLLVVAGAAGFTAMLAPSLAPIAATALALCLLGRPLQGLLKRAHPPA